MSTLRAQRQPRYSKEEFARRGNEIYEREVRPKAAAQDHGRIVAIDIESGAFRVADDTITATRDLIAQIPDAQIWVLERVRKLRGVLRRGILAVAKAARSEHPQRGL